MFAVFADELGMDKEQALMLSSPFGGGFAQMREVCGALSGMFLVMGLKEGCTSTDKQTKADYYEMLRGLEAQFSEKYKTNNCTLLLKMAEDAGLPRPCEELVGLAAEIAEAKLASRR
ncbi:MAG: C-GCAxxG-C-C family protein [Oscillospiraceae bacterium]|nr:C-GCAxxG-C-C family protein [Oscillospiraceae bacterium]